jgi:hypothetical protein
MGRMRFGRLVAAPEITFGGKEVLGEQGVGFGVVEEDGGFICP